MKNKWLWIIIGTVIILLALAIFAMPYFHSVMMGRQFSGAEGFEQGFRHPMMGGRFGFNGFRGAGFMMPFAFAFMFLGFFFRLLPLAILGLIFWWVYQLGKKAGAKTNASVVPTTSTPPVVEESSKPE